jgi:hypothetical protein
MKRHALANPRQSLIRVLAAQAVKDYLTRQTQQQRWFQQKCTNRVVQKEKESV